MPVQIHITGDTAAEALQELAILAKPLAGGTPAASETKAEAPETPKRGGRTKPAEDKAPPVEEPEEKAAETESSDDGEKLSPEDLRAEVSRITKADPKKKDDIRALLTEYGVKNVSAVPEGKRSAFMAELKKL